jgi:hypothetical protein
VGNSIGLNMPTPRPHRLSGIRTSQLPLESLYYTSHVSSTAVAAIDIRCPVEVQAIGGGCKFRETFDSNLRDYSKANVPKQSYNIISDLAQENYIHQSAPGTI